MDVKNPRKLLTNIFLESLEQCSPGRAIKDNMGIVDGGRLSIQGVRYPIANRPIFVFAVGKAAVPMYEETADILGDHITKSLVVTDNRGDMKSQSGHPNIIYTSHPKPDETSIEAGKRALDFFGDIPANGVVVNLISGGTSSLLCEPAEGMSIGELTETYELLNNSGATIYEINTVRKHCSKIKGGQLLRNIPSQCLVVDLIISDVPNDDMSIVGSGPTIPDKTTYREAYQILGKYNIWDKVPESIQHHIKKGMRGEVKETVKEGEDPIENHTSMVISSASMLAQKTAEIAEEKGLDVVISDEPFNDDVQKVATKIAGRVLSDETDNTPRLFVFWGESTVRVTGSGKGGRNQELALWGATKIRGHQNITWLSAGTDGIDGPTDAAGAIVDSKTVDNAVEKGINPEKYLSNNNSYHFHQKNGTLFKTGATGNNLMDQVLVLVE